MPSGRFSRNTVLAGAFVLLIIAAFVAAIILINDRGPWAAGTSPYTITFRLDEGADGLEAGSPVKLGGVRVGYVTSVEFDPSPKTGQDVLGIKVGIAVDKRLKFYSDAQVTLVRPLLGSNSALNIVNLKRGGEAAQAISAGGTIKGELAPPGFVSQADYAKVQDIINKVQSFSTTANEFVADVKKDWPKPYEDVKETIASGRRMMADAEEVVASTRKKWPDWQADIDAIVKQVRERVDTITQGAKDGIKQFQDFMASAQKVVDDNRASINQSVESVRSVLAKFEKEDYPAAMKKAQDTLAYAESVTRRVEQTVATEVPEIKEFVTQARLSAQQLKLTMTEVRAAPWRLLYQPNKKELENELLYNAVRAYSDSLADVRSAAEALDAAAGSLASTPAGATPAIDRATVEGLAAKLKDSLSKSAEQEKLFYERWIRESPK